MIQEHLDKRYNKLALFGGTGGKQPGGFRQLILSTIGVRDKLMNYIRYWQASGESLKTSIRTKTRLGQIVQEGR